jgi:hypothetical protein
MKKPLHNYEKKIRKPRQEDVDADDEGPRPNKRNLDNIQKPNLISSRTPSPGNYKTLDPNPIKKLVKLNSPSQIDLEVSNTL